MSYLLKWPLIIAGVIVGLVLLDYGLPRARRMWLRWKKNTSANEESWKSYMSVQWPFLVIAIALGFALAWLSVYAGPIRSETPEKNGVLVEPRVIDLNEQKPVYVSQVNVDNFARVTVLTRTKPREGSTDSGAAVVTLNRWRASRGDEIRRIESRGPMWTRWEEDNPKGQMDVIVEPSGTGSQPPLVELIIYLTPKQ